MKIFTPSSCIVVVVINSSRLTAIFMLAQILRVCVILLHFFKRMLCLHYNETSVVCNVLGVNSHI